MISRATLRTPLGQARLIAITLIAAIPFAALLGTQHGFFAGLVREKYGEAGDPEAAAVAAIGSRPTTLAAAEFELVYRHLQRERVLDHVGARALAAAAPAWLVSRAERTLVAGTIEQRRRALEVLGAAELPGTRAMLARVLAHVERVGPAEIVPDLASAHRAAGE